MGTLRALQGLGALGLIGVCCPAAVAQEATLETPYYRVVCDGGGVASLAVDPSGSSRWIASLWHGPRVNGATAGPDTTVLSDATEDGGRVRIEGAVVRSVRPAGTPPAASAVQAPPGASLVQPFVPDGDELLSVSVMIPTWHTRDSSATLRLRRGSPDGEVVAERRIEALVDSGTVTLDLTGARVPGRVRYCLELGDVSGVAGYWVSGGNPVDRESGLLVGDTVQPGTRASMTWVVARYGTAGMTVTISGPTLEFEHNLRGGPREDLLLVWPWEREGYDTENPETTPFRYFVTGDGRYVPVHQFKRRKSHGLEFGGSLYVSGTRGFDVRFAFPEGGDSMHADLESDAMRMRMPARVLRMTVEPASAWLPAYFPRFVASDERAASLLTRFLYSHGLNFGPWVNPDWADWEAIVFAWQENPQGDVLRSLLASGYVVNEEGYVHTWGTPGWPFPFHDEDGDGQNDYDTRHFTTNPCFILGAWRHACWTRDEAFLAAILPRCRAAMDYMLDALGGRDGLILAIGPDHTGKDGGIGNNYWDIQPFGHLDAFANTYYYRSLSAMADLEEWAGDRARADELRALRELARERYTEVFWNDEAGRFVGCVDRDGVAHDYGFTFVNLDAMASGLADEYQVERIYDWMENGVTSSGEADTYSRWIFAPRANTIHNPGRDEVGAEMPPWWSWVWGGTAWEDQCQDGGAILYTSWADIIARARFRGASDAWQRLTEILERYDMPDRLSGGSPLWRGERSQGGPDGGPGQVGVEGEFPESGMVPASVIEAFLGLEARPDGLRLRPALPAALEWLGVENARYAGGRLDVIASRDEVRVLWRPLGGSGAPVSASARLSEREGEFLFRPWEGPVLAPAE